VQRLTCKHCGCDRKDFEQSVSAKLVNAFALLALQLPLDQTEHLLGIKSETIRKHLMSVNADPERWTETRQSLLGLGITDRELDYLRSVIDIGNLTSRCPTGSGLHLEPAEWRRRIEPIIGCRVIIGTSRQGVRVCRGQDFSEFIQRIRRLSFDRLATTKHLSASELNVLRQLHTPNAQAWLLSRLGAQGVEVDGVTGKPLATKLNLKSPADGLNMDVGTFIGIAVTLVRKLGS
jgi:hypothetical protein